MIACFSQGENGIRYVPLPPCFNILTDATRIVETSDSASDS